MSTGRQWHCGNPVCFCTGGCMGKTHASTAVFTQSVEQPQKEAAPKKRGGKKGKRGQS